jgi:hypothetical protein
MLYRIISRICVFNGTKRYEQYTNIAYPINNLYTQQYFRI